MLNSKIEQLKQHFGIFADSDWCDIEPAWILRQDGVGPKTLNYIRLLLSARGLVLKGDKTPEYWKQHLSETQIVETLGDLDEGNDRGILCPFAVLIDSAEQSPYTFQGLRADADQQYRPWIVPTEQHALGRHPDSLGDYSLTGGVGRCHIERKSMEDAHSTILGWGGRRERFEHELENLAAMDAGLVVVECSLADLVRHAPCHGKKSSAENAKILWRSVISYQQDYRVQWAFCESRRMAEHHTFQWLRRWHEKQQQAAKEAERAYFPKQTQQQLLSESVVTV